MSLSLFPYILIRRAGFAPLSLAIEWPREVRREETAQAVQKAFDQALATLPDSSLRTAVYNARKRFFQKKRAPQKAELQAWETHADQAGIAELLTRLQDWEKSETQKQAVTQLLETELLENWRQLQRAAASPDFQKALSFASHDLLDRLPAFCQRPPERFTAKDRQTALAVLQYWQRGAHKTSPLSRFTTVAAWRWEKSRATPASEEPAFMQTPKAVVTPNVALLPALYEVLLTEPAFYESLHLSLNPSMNPLEMPPGWQWLYFDGERESFQQMAYQEAVAGVIRICQEHHRHISYLVLMEKLHQEIEAEESQLQQLVHDLVDLGLLAWQLPERGLTPGWCGGLYTYLGYLPATPLISAAAALLQWLRTAARTLPFQNLAEARTTQKETIRQIGAFFKQHDVGMPPIPAEQIFFEDVERPADTPIPSTVVRQVAEDLNACWQQSAPHRLSSFRSALHAFTASEMEVGATRPFLDFCRQFLAEKAAREKQPGAETAPYPGKTGALLQAFQDENGAYMAVVNGLFPGGGKLAARWLHLFPADVKEKLGAWFPADTVAFPWQGWSNANFQPALAHNALSVPDGRTQPTGADYLLGNLEVQRLAEGPVLRDRISGRLVRFTDLGLEAPESRPPAMQVLWHLGTPAVSLESVWPAEARWENVRPGCRYLPRLVFRSLVLRRAAWRFSPAVWQGWLSASENAGERLLHLRKSLVDNALPPALFLRFFPEKPQFVERDSPAGLWWLEKVLRGGQGDLIVTEALPAGGEPATEWVLEWDAA